MTKWWLLFLVLAIVLAGSMAFVACGCNDDDDDDDTGDDDTGDDDTDDDADDDADDDVDDDADDDTAETVLVSAGNFWMGCEPEDTDCDSDESPRHQVNLSAYYIDVFEVTNERYADFLNDHGNDCEGNECADADSWYIRVHESGGVWTADSGYEDHPIVMVTWYGAKGFCEWTGGRLPTEAEWEKAAKGAAEHFIYPWGDAWIGNAANCVDSGDPFDNGTTPVGYYDGSDHGGAYQTTDGRSPFGAHDMVGNVKEWVNDWYDSDYYDTSPTDDPQGPGTGTYRVLRGGSWVFQTRFLRVSYRYRLNPDGVNGDGGFRCARDE